MAGRILTRTLVNLNSTFNQSLLKLAKPARCLTQLQMSPCLGSSSINKRSIVTTSPMLQSANTGGDLAKFLVEEIRLENESCKHKSDLPQITGFNIKADGPSVTLAKTHNNEQITVKFNVNGSLDDGDANFDQALANEKTEQQTPPELKSRPTFSVDIKKGDHVLSFGCSFLPADESDKNTTEDFQIDEFSIHKGQWDETVYTADCTVLDENLYDLMLNYLDERGIGEKLANELAEFSTAYEHQQYIKLLEKLKDFLK